MPIDRTHEAKDPSLTTVAANLSLVFGDASLYAHLHEDGKLSMYWERTKERHVFDSAIKLVAFWRDNN